MSTCSIEALLFKLISTQSSTLSCLFTLVAYVFGGNFSNMKTVFLFLIFTLFRGFPSKVIPQSERNGCAVTESYIDCKHAKGKFLPAVEIKSVQIILITLCDMSDLTAEDFAAFPEVTIIEVRASIFSFPVQNGLFRHLYDLTDLRIEGCDVGDDVGTLFAENRFLERLYLRNNRIESISNHLLKNLTKLQEVDLSGNNAPNLEDGAFDGLENLRMLNLAGNALNGSTSGVVASSTTRCKVCRPKGIRSKCTREEVEHCISGRPLDKLWWRAAALTVHLRGNPLCDDLGNHPLETQPSGEWYRGGVECEILHGEGDCGQHKQRRLFLTEACSIAYNSTNEITVLEGGTKKSIIIGISTGVVGITIGILLTTLLLKLKNLTKLQVMDSSGNNASNLEDGVLDGRENLRMLNMAGNALNGSTSGVVARDSRPDEEEQHELLPNSKLSDESRPVPGDSPLHSAALDGNLETLKELKTKGEDLTEKNSRGESPLWCAAFAGHHKVVKYLLDNIPPGEIQSADHNGNTSLHIAAKEGNRWCTEFLLEAGANSNAKNNEGSTPLHVAVSTEFMYIIQLLLDNGTSINETNVKGETPLLVAVRSGQLKAVKLLLEKGADVNLANRVQQLPLHIAAWNENYKIVDFLLSRNAPINTPDVHGNTILHCVCKKGHLSEVKRLLFLGADKNARNKRNKTPLHKAVEGDHFETVQLLLREGANVTIENSDGLTPLKFSQKIGSKKCEKELLKHHFLKNI